MWTQCKALLSKLPIPEVRGFFHWKYSSSLIFFFYGLAVATIEIGLAVEPFQQLFSFAYLFFTCSLIWAVGWWLTSELLERKRPKLTRKQRKNKERVFDVFYRAWKWGIPLVMGLVFLYSIQRTQRIELARELSLLHGALAPANDPDPPNLCSLVDDELGLYFGNMQVKASRFPLTVVRIAGKPAIIMDRNADHSLSLSLDVRSADGRIIARLDRNILTVNPNNYLSMERKDRSTLSVTDQNGIEVLHARYLNRRSFKLSAHLISEGRTVDLSSIPISGVCLGIEHGPEGAGAIGVP